MSLLGKIGTYFEIVRPYNLFVPAGIGLTGAILAYGGIPPLYLLLIAMFFPILLWAAGQIINDYLNFEEDSIGKPFLPLPSGRIGKKEALAISVMIFLIVTVSTAYYSLYGAAVVVAIIIGTTYYSAGLKKKGIFGNLLFGTMVASCLILGALISTGRINELIILVFFAILVNHTTLNLIGTLKDIEVDGISNAKYLVQIKGIHTSIIYIIVISTSALILSLMPWILGYLKDTYILIPVCSYLFQMRALSLVRHSPSVRNGFEALKIYRTASIPLYISFTAGVPGFSIVISGICALVLTISAEILQEIITEEPIRIKAQAGEKCPT